MIFYLVKLINIFASQSFEFFIKYSPRQFNESLIIWIHCSFKLLVFNSLFRLLLNDVNFLSKSSEILFQLSIKIMPFLLDLIDVVFVIFSKGPDTKNCVLFSTVCLFKGQLLVLLTVFPAISTSSNIHQQTIVNYIKKIIIIIIR